MFHVSIIFIFFSRSCQIKHLLPFRVFAVCAELLRARALLSTFNFLIINSAKYKIILVWELNFAAFYSWLASVAS